MGKNKKQNTKEAAAPAPEAAAPAVSDPAQPQAGDAPAPANPAATVRAQPRSRLRRLLPDLVKVALALAVIGLGTAIWIKPPLIRASFPYVTYSFDGQTHTDAVLYRPLAMPTRYYIRLPRQLAARYTWFAVDRRREVAALAEAPKHRFLGRDAIKRSDPLGLDLEFRKLDHSEWRVYFFDSAILFSNALLVVRMDTKRRNTNDGN